jgi:hypothetical protein
VELAKVQSLTHLYKRRDVIVEQVKVPFPVLVDRFNIIAKSDNAILDSKHFMDLEDTNYSLPI